MLAPAQIVLNSVAIGFVFELDDVLYATMVTPMMMTPMVSRGPSIIFVTNLYNMGVY